MAFVNKKFIKTTLLSFSIILIILNVPFISVSATSYTWNVRKGDSFHWNYFDEYYSIDNTTTKYTVISSESNHTETNCYASYDVIKEWSYEDLNLYVKSTNPNIKHINITFNYFPSTLGIFTFTKFYNYTNGNDLNTKIPRIIDPNDVDINSINSWSGMGGIDFSLDVAFVNIDSDILPIAKYNLFGSTTIQFTDINNTILDSIKYLYQYITPDFETSPYDRYENVGLKIEVKDITEMPQDLDNKDDLLLMVTNTVNAYGMIVGESPSYFDFDMLFNFLTMIISILNKVYDNDAIPESLGGGIIPLTFGFSIPSGMTVLYSDAAELVKMSSTFGSMFTNTILIPVLLGTLPNVEGLISQITTDYFSPTFIFNTIALLSLTNYMILPSSLNFTDIKDGFDYFNNQMSSLSGNVAQPIGSFDIMGMLYLLSNVFKTELTNDYLTIELNSKSLPTIFDTKNAHTSFGAVIKWNIKTSILEDFYFTIDCPIAGYGHKLGMTYDKNHIINKEDKSWYKSVTNIILMISSVLGGLGTVGYMKKKKINKNMPFKDILQKECSSNDPFCDNPRYF